MIKNTMITFSLMLFVAACGQQEQTSETPTEKNWYDALPRASWAKLKSISTNQNWFEIYQLSPDTYAIYEPNQWQEVISYLLIGTDRALLVDTGMGIGDLKAVIDQLTDLPITVINTHTHYDHVGSNHQFDIIYGRDTDFTKNNALGHPHADFVSMQSGEPVNSVGIDTIWKDLPDGFELDQYHSKPFSIDKYIENGEKIDLGNRTIEIIFIPGHTPDSIALLDRGHKYLLTGDSFYLAPIYVRGKETNFEDYLNSTKIMADLENAVDFVLGAHNETMQESTYLKSLFETASKVYKPDQPYEQGNGTREYKSDGFSILVKDIQ
jgi:glyoxylase-like metal-dependent hydrolase (beta-lactamase superfamily II)